jgi:hypothetical protein
MNIPTPKNRGPQMGPKISSGDFLENDFDYISAICKEQLPM